MIEYAGVNLCYEPPELKRFLDMHMPVDELVAWSRRPGPVPYPDPPAPRINQLYMPTGAGRWGYFLGLASDDQIKAIQKKTESASESSSSLTLKLGDGDNVVEYHMIMLTPRKVAATDPSFWLVPLVDTRYEWAHNNSTVESDGSWGDVVAKAYLNALRTYSDFEPDGGYLVPDEKQLLRDSRNIADVLDLAAHSCGSRIVPRFKNFPVPMTKTETSTALLEQSFSFSNWQALAGWISSTTFAVESLGVKSEAPALPGSIFSHFPQLNQHVPVLDGVTSSISYKPNEAGFPNKKSNPRHVINFANTCYADIDTDGSTLNNDSDLTALALLIAQEQFYYFTHQHDIVLNGVVPWKMNGLDDHTLITVGALRDDDDGGGRIYTTRVQSTCTTAIPDKLYHQDSDLFIAESLKMKGVVTETTEIAAGGSGDVELYDLSGTTTGETVTGYLDWAEGGEAVSEDKEVFVYYIREAGTNGGGRWQIDGAECE